MADDENKSMTVRDLIVMLTKRCNMDADVHISFMGSDSLPVTDVDEEDEGAVIIRHQIE